MIKGLMITVTYFRLPKYVIQAPNIKNTKQYLFYKQNNKVTWKEWLFLSSKETVVSGPEIYCIQGYFHPV